MLRRESKGIFVKVVLKSKKCNNSHISIESVTISLISSSLSSLYRHLPNYYTCLINDRPPLTVSRNCTMPHYLWSFHVVEGCQKICIVAKYSIETTKTQTHTHTHTTLSVSHSSPLSPTPSIIQSQIIPSPH